MTTSRTALLDAVVGIAAERGLDAASVREVATAAGVSIGAVQHHFPTKDDLLLAAFLHVSDAFAARWAGLDLAAAPREAIRRAMAELLPLDDVRATEARVWLAFAARAAVAPRLAEAYAQGLAELRGALEEGLRRARAAGALRSAAAPDKAALLLSALVDGLAVQAVATPAPVSSDAMLGALDLALDGLFDASADGPDAET